MKTRNGFVSNSSSSSFIIGVAKVLDKEKLLNIVKDLDNCKIFTKKGLEVYALSRASYDFSIWDGYITLKAHTNNAEECWADLSDEKESDFFIVNTSHGEEDGPFMRNDGFYGLDYSIVNEDYFKKNYPDSYELLQLLKGVKGITECKSFKYGVSRCG